MLRLMVIDRCYDHSGIGTEAVETTYDPKQISGLAGLEVGM